MLQKALDITISSILRPAQTPAVMEFLKTTKLGYAADLREATVMMLMTMMMTTEEVTVAKVAEVVVVVVIREVASWEGGTKVQRE
jgi:hypothetical protein